MEKKKQTEGTVFISEADQYLFAQGTHYDIYKKLGAHPSVENGRKGTFFGVWAPNAASVHVICLLYTSPSPRDRSVSRMPSSA